MFVLGNKEATLFVAQRGHGITGVLSGAEFFNQADHAILWLATQVPFKMDLYVIPIDLQLKVGWLTESRAVKP